MKQAPLWMLVLLLTSSASAFADLRLDANIKQKEEVEKRAESLFKSVVTPYAMGRPAEFDSDKPGVLQDNGHFAWIFNGRSLFSMIGGFAPSDSPLKDCPTDSDEISPRSRCNLKRQAFWDCHLFMLDGQDRKIGSVTRLNIMSEKKQLDGVPSCLSVDAVAAAKALPDAMLITLSYIDSYIAQEIDFHMPKYQTTLLLRFRDENGKLVVEQDDRCLGNPNKYQTIAAARKALAACAGANPVKKQTGTKQNGPDYQDVQTRPCAGAVWQAPTGSATVFINGRPAVREGDATQHCGGAWEMIEGSPDMLIGDDNGVAAGAAGSAPDALEDQPVYSQVFDIGSMLRNDPLLEGAPYQIWTIGGEPQLLAAGTIDNTGRTVRVFTKGPQEIELIVGEDEWLSVHDDQHPGMEPDDMDETP